MRRIALLGLAAGLLLSVPLAARQPLRARHGMVVAMESIAADVGVSVLQKGGNAVDAAVAVGFAMAVTHPFAGNIGGGGYMLIRMADGRTTFIDFRERAPEKASRNMYLDAKGELTRDSIEGWRSSGVPGTVRGFEIAVDEVRQAEVGREHGAGGGARVEGLPGLLRAGREPQGIEEPRGARPSRSGSSRRTARSSRSATRSSQPELAQTLERISKNGAERILRRRNREALRRRRWRSTAASSRSPI